MEWRVALEGPYAGKLSIMHKKYDDAIFIAGGAGVPGMLEGAAHSTTGKFICAAQKMELVLAYRSLIRKISIPFDIHLTRENAENRRCTMKELLSDTETESQTNSTDTSNKDVSDKEVESTTNQKISFFFGRPNIKEVIEAEMSSSSPDNVCICACGPPAMMDTLRNTIAENVTNWTKSVDFFDEFQTWLLHCPALAAFYPLLFIDLLLLINSHHSFMLLYLIFFTLQYKFILAPLIQTSPLRSLLSAILTLPLLDMAFIYL